MEFQIGDTVEVSSYNNGKGRWFHAVIVEIEQNRVKVQYSPQTEGRWIKIDKNRLAPIHTNTIPYFSMDQILFDDPNQQQRRITQALYYHHRRSGHFITYGIIWDRKANKALNPMLERFDINKQTWSTIQSFDDSIQRRYSICLNKYDKKIKLYVISCEDNRNKPSELDIAIYDPIKNRLIEQKYCEIAKYDTTYKPPNNLWIDCKFIAKDKMLLIREDQIEIIIFEGNYIKSKVIDMTIDHRLHNIRIRGVFVCDTLQKLMCFSSKGCSQSLYESDISVQTLKWTPHDVYSDILCKTQNKRYILISDYILLMFYGHRAECKNIECLDLLHYQRYKLDKIYSAATSGSDAVPILVRGDGDWIYIFNGYSCYKTLKRVSIYDCIPDELSTFWKEKYTNPLIFGYIARMKKEYQEMSAVPIDVVSLILAYFPTFL
eukprot:491846_1